MAIDHTNCTHARTPAGRRECRTLGGPAGWAAANSAAINKPTGMPEPIIAGDYIGEHIRKTAANHTMKARMDREYAEVRMTGQLARRMARQAAKADMARPQPRRSGARVSTGNSSCVQAALHIDAHGGRCACGWEAAS